MACAYARCPRGSGLRGGNWVRSSLFAPCSACACAACLLTSCFMRTIKGGEQLNLEVVSVMAHAMKERATEKGAAHCTHWFQPLAGIASERRDSFPDPVSDGASHHRGAHRRGGRRFVVPRGEGAQAAGGSCGDQPPAEEAAHAALAVLPSCRLVHPVANLSPFRKKMPTARALSAMLSSPQQPPRMREHRKPNNPALTTVKEGICLSFGG